MNAYGSENDEGVKQLTVLNSKNDESTYSIYPNTSNPVSSAGLIDSDNYSIDAAQLNDIDTGVKNSYSAADFNTIGTMGMGMGMSQKQDFMTSFASSNKK